jgi:hypothetical protein
MDQADQNRAELAKSLKAYVKNHFSTGIASVTTSQYPLLPPQPEPTSAEVPETNTSEAEDIETEKAATPRAEKEEPVTDVVEEQVGGGEIEPVPTPAAGGEAEHVDAEVTDKRGIEQVDEELEELKVEDKVAGETGETAESSTADAPAAETGTDDEVKQAGSNTPQVTEEETKVEAGTESQSVAAVEERKQETVENPTFTLEVVGNKYKTNSFW